MAGSIAPKIVTDGLVLFLDGANPKSVDTENLALNSESINLWGNNAGAVLVTPNAEIAPDGTQTADVLEQTNVNIPPSGASRWVSSINNRTYVGGITYTLSIWLKKVSGTDTQPPIYLWAQNGFTLDSFNMVGTITTEWRRYTRTFTPAATVSSPNSGLNIGWNVFGVANNFKFAAWGFQIETGSSARDYVRTTSTPKLRTRWFDLSKNVNTGLLVGTPSFLSSNSGGIVFDGTNNYVNLPEITPTRFTLSCWFMATGTPSTNDSYGGNLIVSNPQLFGGAIQYGLYYSWLDQTVGFAVQQNGPGTITSNNSVLRNTIYNAVGVFTGTRNQIYINGSFVTETINTNEPIYPTTGDRSARIGAWNAPGFGGFTRFFNGNIYQASIYNRALSASEIQQNFKATKSRFGL